MSGLGVLHTPTASPVGRDSPAPGGTMSASGRPGSPRTPLRRSHSVISTGARRTGRRTSARGTPARFSKASYYNQYDSDVSLDSPRRLPGIGEARPRLGAAAERSLRKPVSARPVPRRRREVLPPDFDGLGLTFSDYLVEFGRTADFNDWQEEEKCFHLWNSITGGARSRILTLTYSKSWPNLVAQLSSIFCADRMVEGHRVKWMDAQRDAGMDLDAYGHKLLDMSRKANPVSAAAEQERFAKEKFVQTAGSAQLKFWLRALRPATLQDAIDVAMQYESACELTQQPRVQKPEGANSVFMPAPAVALPTVNAIAEPLPQSAALNPATTPVPSTDVASGIIRAMEEMLQDRSRAKPQDRNDDYRPRPKGKFRDNKSRDNRARGRRDNRDRRGRDSPPVCYYCHKPGHIKRDCKALRYKLDRDQERSPRSGDKRPADRRRGDSPRRKRTPDSRSRQEN